MSQSYSLDPVSMGGLDIIATPVTVMIAVRNGKTPHFSLRKRCAANPTKTEEQELITTASATGMYWIAIN